MHFITRFGMLSEANAPYRRVWSIVYLTKGIPEPRCR